MNYVPKSADFVHKLANLSRDTQTRQLFMDVLLEMKFNKLTGMSPLSTIKYGATATGNNFVELCLSRCHKAGILFVDYRDPSTIEVKEIRDMVGSRVARQLYYVGATGVDHVTVNHKVMSFQQIKTKYPSLRNFGVKSYEKLSRAISSLNEEDWCCLERRKKSVLSLSNSEVLELIK